jgi:YggT family protein
MWQTVAHDVELGLRGLALVAFGGSLLVPITQSAVRRKLIRQTAWWPLFVRRWSRPFVRPIERRLAAGGQDPQDAGLWLLGIVVVASLLVLTVYGWLIGTVLLLLSMREAGVEAWLRLLLGAATTLIMAAIVVRVIGLWLGLGRYHRWLRFAYRLTDWLIEPIRRRLPPTGMLDLSPLVAYLLLFLLRLVVG